MQVQHESAALVPFHPEAVIELGSDDHARGEVEAVVMDGRVREARPAWQLRVPDVQPLVALELDLHEAEPVQGDFVRHYVIDNHPITAFMVSTNGSQKKRVQPIMQFVIMAQLSRR
jgi:hypothetical protein